MKAVPCQCGYFDKDFCPLHGSAMAEILRAYRDGGINAAEEAAKRYAKDDEETAA